MEENKHFTIDWTNCRLCPRECGADRTRGFGACKVGNTITAARAALHMWEEPCISGDDGSGAVFFSGCNLGCVYCQNREIALGHSGRTITQDRLCEIYMELQEKKANNINLVTAGHYLPIVIESIKRARKSGLTIPIVYNSSGYEKVEAIEALDGIVDIFLPDFKYISSEMAARYSNAPDYPEIAKRALAQMVKQTGDAKFDERDMMKRGVIVRHLILPGHIKESKEAIRYLYETYGDQIYISIMNQYTPMPGIEKRFKNLGRTITQKEYVQYLMEADTALHAVHKTKYRFCIEGRRFEIDVYPFSESRAIMRAELPAEASAPQTPQGIEIIREVTGDPMYKNSRLAREQKL